MKFIQESLKNVRRLDNEDEPTDNNEHPSGEEIDFDLDGEPTSNDEHPEGPFGHPAYETGEDMDEPSEEPVSDDEFNLDQEPEKAENQDIDNIANRASEDPNRRGLIRSVAGTHLVYKRETEDGTFEELWIFNVDDLRNEMQIRKSILAGTDIPTNNTSSPDGKQTYTIWTSGNVEFIKVIGLPS